MAHEIKQDIERADIFGSHGLGSYTNIPLSITDQIEPIIRKIIGDHVMFHKMY